jgi:hypothetical protein
MAALVIREKKTPVYVLLAIENCFPHSLFLVEIRATKKKMERPTRTEKR